ncbi:MULTISPECIES: type IV pilus modification PilV family protein [unclassified Sedimentibacter]|uniref:type IV pilus modification PilV family protein n=1 Tax=unclassified Sedimentibacter TaxID=2649220 RepID=UPI0027E0FD9B|nr:hypothetical protein [Sedimentibacter sp. MB35-C1]WMJ76697.1 hypothetical protein RBQ61_14125 [Sedimentibacter sp. MB35-C1]
MKNKVSINLELSLVEIIISILIFAVSGVIILNCFAAAKFTQLKANDMVTAGNIIQSTAEIIKSSNNIDEMNDYMDSNFNAIKSNGNNISYINYLSNTWTACSEHDSEYSIMIEISSSHRSSGILKDIVITALKSKPYPFIDREHNSTVVYKIETKKFFPLNDVRR